MSTSNRAHLGRARTVLRARTVCRARTSFIGALVALTSLAVLAPLLAQAAGDNITIDTGKLHGATADGVTSFKGIPFAQPPLGNFRWKPPQPVANWQGVREATSYGADCMQDPFPGDAAPLGVTPNEDCLYINVWVPAKAGGVATKLPVMFWIYGGGFVNGGASPAVYDGSQFAKDGVIHVSANYRLGNLGFFSHPALTAEQPASSDSEELPAANWALMDQVAALKWVQRNIAAFGGDPANVTIFGESAGGMSVNMLLTSPLTDGLFQKAIIESGGGRAGIFPDTPNSTNFRAVSFRMGGDLMMVEPAREIARLLSAHGQPVYEFRFSYVVESLRKTTPGAPHATEIPFAFDTVAARYGKDLTAADEAAAKVMHKYWVAFARTGAPDVPGQPAWPRYDGKTDAIMDFTNNGPVAGPDPWKARLDLAERLNNRNEHKAGK